MLGIYFYDCYVCFGTGLVPDAIQPGEMTICPYCDGTDKTQIEIVVPDEPKEDKDADVRENIP